MKGWTEERRRMARKLWLEGLSAAAIGGDISRNAVIGFISRERLQRREKAPARPQLERPISRPAKIAPPAPGPVRGTLSASGEGVRVTVHGGRPTCEAVERARADLQPRSLPRRLPAVSQGARGPVSLSDIEQGQCRWPIGEPADEAFRFCGVEAVLLPGGRFRSYCAAHCAVAYIEVPRRPIKGFDSSIVRAPKARAGDEEIDLVSLMGDAA